MLQKHYQPNILSPFRILWAKNLFNNTVPKELKGIDECKDRIRKSLMNNMNDENSEEIEFLLKRL